MFCARPGVRGADRRPSRPPASCRDWLKRPAVCGPCRMRRTAGTCRCRDNQSRTGEESDRRLRRLYQSVTPSETSRHLCAGSAVACGARPRARVATPCRAMSTALLPPMRAQLKNTRRAEELSFDNIGPIHCAPRARSAASARPGRWTRRPGSIHAREPVQGSIRFCRRSSRNEESVVALTYEKPESNPKGFAAAPQSTPREAPPTIGFQVRPIRTDGSFLSCGRGAPGSRNRQRVRPPRAGRPRFASSPDPEILAPLRVGAPRSRRRLGRRDVRRRRP